MKGFDMKRLTTTFLVMLLTFILGVAAASAWLSSRARHAELSAQNKVAPPANKTESITRTEQVFRLDVPKATWEPIFFESIDERAKTAKLRSLRAPLPEGDLELRVWGGFGLTSLEGFVLRRSSGRWSAIHLDGIYQGLPRNKYQLNLSEPKSGWDATWQRFVSLGILDLPDAESAGCSTRVNDGFSYVVETNVNSTYRTYMYDNPEYSKCDDAKRMLAIAAAIADEFGVQEFKPEDYK
jgi:hypothetical protein